MAGQDIEGDKYTLTPINSAASSQDISLVIKDGSFSRYVYGADRLKKGSLVRYGSIDMTIQDGHFSNVVVGGIGYTQATPTAFAVLEGDINMTISGGTFDKYVYGGCLAGKKTYASATSIIGSITVTLDVDSGSEAHFKENLIVGSHGFGHVLQQTVNGKAVGGNVSLVVSGAGTVTVDGQIWGACSGDYYVVSGNKRTFETSIEGERLLSFSGFTGNMNCDTIRGFESVEFKSDADGNASLFALNNQCNLSDIENWRFELGSGIVDGNFTNDFTGDKLTLAGFADIADPQTLMVAAHKAFNGFGGLASVTLDGVGQAQKASNTLWYWGAADQHTYELKLQSDETKTSMILARLA